MSPLVNSSSREESIPTSESHVIVGMSGGVDSSVAALLLKEQGYRVSGIFMQNWEDDDEQCTARQDYRDASAVAARLGIPLSTVNFAEEYWERVFEHFLAEYQAGRTPNPDILCNREIKFAAFLDHARLQGADHIATGHYVRSATTGHSSDLAAAGAADTLAEPGSNASDLSEVTLLRGLDTNKDQSYFLYTLGQEQLAPSLFPVGELEKSTVRDLARRAGFATASKKDSTGICFIGERKFTRFLSEYLPATPGEIVTDHGDVVGRHNGLMFHTLGQRQGLGIGGRQDASEAPWYVLDKQLDENRLIVGQGHNHPMLLRDSLEASDVHWVKGVAPQEKFTCSVKVRYRQEDQQACVEVSGNGDIKVNFEKPVRAITPGQSVVLYDGERCLGGAIINDLNPLPTLLPRAGSQSSEQIKTDSNNRSS